MCAAHRNVFEFVFVLLQMLDDLELTNTATTHKHTRTHAQLSNGTCTHGKWWQLPGGHARTPFWPRENRKENGKWITENWREREKARSREKAESSSCEQ